MKDERTRVRYPPPPPISSLHNAFTSLNLHFLWQILSNQSKERGKIALVINLNMLKDPARTAVKSVLSAIEEKKIDEAKSLFKNAEKTLDKLASKKVIHKNKSSRIKSRLLKKIKSS